MNETSLAVFENFKIRRIYDEGSETWLFSVVDIIQVLLQQTDRKHSYQCNEEFFSCYKYNAY